MVWSGVNFVDAQHGASEAEVLAGVDLAVVDQHCIGFPVFEDGPSESRFDGRQSLVGKGLQVADESRMVV